MSLNSYNRKLLDSNYQGIFAVAFDVITAREPLLSTAPERGSESRLSHIDRPAHRGQFWLRLLGLCVIAWGAGGCQPTPIAEKSGSLASEGDFRQKVAEIRMDKQNVVRAIARMEKSKGETVAFLKKRGVSSLADVGEDDSLKYAVRNLQRDTEEINRLSQQLREYDRAIESLQAMLTEIERKRLSDSVALNPEDYVQLQKIVVQLDERLGIDPKDIFANEALDELLKEEMQKAPSSPTDTKSEEDSKSAGN